MINCKFLIAASFSVALAGCSTAGMNTSMYSVHQPVVERTNYAIDVNTSSNGLSSAEQVRVAEWFDALKLGYGDRIAVDYGNGGYSNATVRQDVSDLAKTRGMLIGDTAPVTAGNVEVGTVRIVVSRSKASVPSCPDWSKSSDRNYNSANHSNYGCAMNSNLAAMVADPEDLVRGQETARIDSNSGSKAVKALRDKPAVAGVTK